MISPRSLQFTKGRRCCGQRTYRFDQRRRGRQHESWATLRVYLKSRPSWEWGQPDEAIGKQRGVLVTACGECGVTQGVDGCGSPLKMALIEPVRLFAGMRSPVGEDAW